MRLQLKNKGFTLLEVVITIGVLVFSLTALLATFISCFDLFEITKNSNLALNAEMKILEEMRRSNFLNLYANYNGYVFQIYGMDPNFNLGFVSIDNSNPDLLEVNIGACWVQKGGRIIGEGSLNGGVLEFSDSNGNGILDSPVALTTYIARR
jgi:type II secretory pathway pseudopilin PulG